MLINHLRRHAQVQDYVVTLTTTRTLYIPRDPARFLIAIGTNTGNNPLWMPSDLGDIGPIFWVTTTTGALVLTEDLHGPLVRSPWWGSVPSTTLSVRVVTFAYTQRSQMIIDEYVKRELSKLGSF